MRTWAAVACVVGCLGIATVSWAGASSIDSLGWMEGRWTGVMKDVHMEEHWTSPAGGSLVGMHKDVKAGRTLQFEFLRIEAREDGIFYLASPRGATPTPFKLVAQSDRRVVFENATHDFPQRILYWSSEPDELRARIEGTVGGKERSMEWRWTRARP